MTDSLYFLTSRNHRSIRWRLTRLGTRCLRLCCPKLAERTLRRMLSPCARSKVTAAPKHFTLTRVGTYHGNLQVYSVGQGPVVLFLHGVMGSGSQFFDLMQSVADKGYRAITFDQYAHGKSQGAEYHIPLLINASQTVLDEMDLRESLVATVSHSVGSIVALCTELKHDTNHFMIAPLFGLLAHYQERADRFGIDPALFAATLTGFEREYDFRFRDISEEPRLAKLTARVQIVHNQGDRIAPIAASQKVASRFSGVSLETQPGNAHSRIIRSDATASALLKFLG